MPGTGSVGIEDRDSARLFVGGLPYECTAEELRALIDQLQFSLDPSQCQLLECRVLPNRGCGYVRFSSWEAAQECIQALNERSVTGWQLPLRVRWATPKSALQAPPGVGGGLGGCGALGQSGAMDGGLNANAVSSALQALLGGDAGAAVAQLTGGSFNMGALANVPTATSEEEAAVVSQGMDPTRLFVGQLTRELNDQATLQAYFEQYGQIEGVRWLQDKGVAYIKYTDFSAAKAAVAGLDRKHIQGVSTQQGLNVQFSKVR
jgi:RNA recognition motif-containing protein